MQRANVNINSIWAQLLRLEFTHEGHNLVTIWLQIIDPFFLTEFPPSSKPLTIGFTGFCFPAIYNGSCQSYCFILGLAPPYQLLDQLGL
jgi:hypothetical protein